MQSGLYFVHTLVCDVVVEGTVLLFVHVGGLCYFPGYSGTTGHSGGSCGCGGVMACKKKFECKLNFRDNALYQGLFQADVYGELPSSYCKK